MVNCKIFELARKCKLCVIVAAKTAHNVISQNGIINCWLNSKTSKNNNTESTIVPIKTTDIINLNSAKGCLHKYRCIPIHNSENGIKLLPNSTKPNQDMLKPIKLNSIFNNH